MATTEPTTEPTPPAPTSKAVEHYRERGVILPGTQGEIAAYLARRRGE